jgi:hypothetical protein
MGTKSAQTHREPNNNGWNEITTKILSLAGC